MYILFIIILIILVIGTLDVNPHCLIYSPKKCNLPVAMSAISVPGENDAGPSNINYGTGSNSYSYSPCGSNYDFPHQ